MAPRAVDGGRRRSPEGRVDAPYNHIYPGELETQNPYYYSVRAAIRLLLTSGGRWLVESDESWSLHGLGACSTQRGGEAKSPSTLQERKKAYQHSTKKLFNDPNPPARLLRARSSSSSADERALARRSHRGHE